MAEIFEVIYQDEQRTIERHRHTLEIRNARGTKSVSLSAEVRTTLKKDEIGALRKAGFNPAEWYALSLPNGYTFALLPLVTRAAVETALRARQEWIEEQQRDPANIERNRIEDLYIRSRRAYENGDWSECYQLKAEADQALTAWRAQYPEAAQAERRSALLAKADDQESLAVGALTYDADGWISPEEQEKRAAAFRAKAAELRSEANANG